MDKLFQRIPTTPSAANNSTTDMSTTPITASEGKHHVDTTSHSHHNHHDSSHGSIPHYALGTSSSINHSVAHQLHSHDNEDSHIHIQHNNSSSSNQMVHRQFSSSSTYDGASPSGHHNNTTQSEKGKTPKSSTTSPGEENVCVVVRVRPVIPECDEEEKPSPAPGASMDDLAQRGNRSITYQVKSCVSVLDNGIIRVASTDGTAVPQQQAVSRIDKKIETYGSKKELAKDKNFTFDHILDNSSTQDDVYDLVYPYVLAAMEGYNATIMAYGPQSGGKTFTMTGTLEHAGIIPRVIDTIFDEIMLQTDPSLGHNIFNVELSYVEIYNNTFKNLLQIEATANGSGKTTSGVNNNALNSSQTYAQKFGYNTSLLNSFSFDAASKDLDSVDSRDDIPVRGSFSRQSLVPDVIANNPTASNNTAPTTTTSNRNPDKIDIRESPIFGPFLSPEVRVPVSSSEEAINMIAKGDTQRTFSQTGRVTSTRGHAIITIFVESKLSISKEQAEENPFLKGKLKLGKIHLIDLASGERVANTSAAGEELSEGLNINKSLLALNDIFHSLYVLASQAKKKKLAEEAFSPDKKTVGNANRGSPIKTPSKPTATPSRSVFSPSNVLASASASTPGTQHVPYLHSKLTHYLRESFGGNGKSMMIVNIPPGDKYYHDNIRALTLASKAKKAINNPYPLIFDITADFVIDKKSELSIIAQLKKRITDSLMRSPIKKGGKISTLPSQPKAKSYNFLIRNILLTDIPYVGFPMRPWLKLELKGATFRTQKQLSKLQHVHFLEEFTFELDSSDYEEGIELSIQVFNKIPFRSKVELARVQFRIADSFPVMIDNKMKKRFPMESCVETDKTPMLYMHGSVRPSLASKVSFFDRPAANGNQSPRKLPTIVCRQTIRTAPPPVFDPNKCYVLSLKSFTTTDALITTSDNNLDMVGGYKFCLEAKFGSEKRRSAMISGRARYRGKDKISTIFFDEPDLKFKTYGSQIKSESIYLILYVKGSDVSSQVIGRVIQPVAELLNAPGSDDVATMEFQAQLKDVTGKVTGRVTFGLKLHSTSVLKEADEYLDENYHIQRNLKVIPGEINQGWIRITSVEGIRMNTLKLLGLHARYCYSTCDEAQLHSVVKQDLMLVMEYGEHWIATSQLMQDQEDTCNWTNLDFKIFGEREDLLKNSLKISVFNRKVEGKEGLIGSCAISLHQILDSQLSINKAPVYLKTRRGKPNGRLLISGVLVKDNVDSWMVAHVVKVRHDGKYDIQYEDGEIEHNVSKDLLLLYNHDPRARHQSFKVNLARPRSKYQVGMRVEVLYGGKDLWYPAVITADHGNQLYDVETEYDIPKLNVQQANIRLQFNESSGINSGASVAMSTATNYSSPTNAGSYGGRSRSHTHTKFVGYGMGDKVEANFKSKGKWYLATIWKVTVGDDGINRYDLDYDSGVREHKVTDDKLRPAFATKYYHTSKAYHAAGRLRENSTAPPMDPAALTSSGRHSLSPFRQRSPSFTNLLASTSADDHSVGSNGDAALPMLGGSGSFEQHFEIGDLVYANYRERGSYLPGTVDDIDSEGLLTIVYENGDCDAAVDPDSVRRVEDHNMSTEKDDEATATITSTTFTDPSKHAFKINDKVEANYRGIGKWLPAQISKSRGGGVFDLIYEDGRIETKVTPDCMRIYDPDLKEEFNFEVNDEVEVNSKGLGYWYPCKIAKQRIDGTYDIIFEDNETEQHVPEKFLRFPRRDKDIIPNEKPVFSVGDKVYVKSRSRAVEQEIKTFQENKLKAEKQLKELFKILRVLEVEQAMYKMVQDRCLQEKEKFGYLKIDLQNLIKIDLPSESVAEGVKVLTTAIEQENKAAQERQASKTFEERIKEAEAQLKKKLARISQLEKRLGLVCTHIALSTRSGLEEAEIHSITSGTTDLQAQFEEMEFSKKKCQEITEELYAQARKRIDGEFNILSHCNMSIRTLAESLAKIVDEAGAGGNNSSSTPGSTASFTKVVSKGSSSTNLPQLIRDHTESPMIPSNGMATPGGINPACSANNSRNSPAMYADDEVLYDVYCNENYDEFAENDKENQASASDKLQAQFHGPPSSTSARVMPFNSQSKPAFVPSFEKSLKTGLGTLLLGSKIPGPEDYALWNENHPYCDQEEDELVASNDLNKSTESTVSTTNKSLKKVLKKSSWRTVGLEKRVSTVQSHRNAMTKYIATNPQKSSNIVFPDLEIPSLVNRRRKSFEANAPTAKGEDMRINEAKRSLEEKRLRTHQAELTFRKVFNSSREKEICEAMQKSIDKFIEDFHLRHVVESRGSDEIDRHRQFSELERKHAEYCETKRTEAMKMAEYAHEMALEKFDEVLENKRPDQPPIIVYAPLQPGQIPRHQRSIIEDHRLPVSSAEEYIMLLESAKRGTVDEWSRWEEAILLAVDEKNAYHRWSHTLKRRLRDLKNLTIKIHESIEEYKQTYKARVDSADVINELKMKVDVKRKELTMLNDSIERESLTYDRLLKKANEASLTSKVLVRQASTREVLKRSNSRSSVYVAPNTTNVSISMKTDDHYDALSDDGLSIGTSNSMPVKDGEEQPPLTPNNQGIGHFFNADVQSLSGKEHPFLPTTPGVGNRRKSVMTTTPNVGDFQQVPPRSGRRQSMPATVNTVIAMNAFQVATSGNSSRRQVDDPHDKAVEVKQKRLSAESEMKAAKDKSEQLFREIRRAENFWVKNEKEAFMIATSEDNVCPASAKDLSSYYALNSAKAHISTATELRKDLQEYLEIELRVMSEVITYCDLEKKCFTDAINQIVTDSEVLSNFKHDIEVEVGHESSKKKLEKERLELLEIKEKVHALEIEIRNHQRMLQSTLGSQAHTGSNNASANSVIAEEQAKRQECIDQATKFDALSIQKEAEIDVEAIERIGKEFYAINSETVTTTVGGVAPSTAVTVIPGGVATIGTNINNNNIKDRDAVTTTVINHAQLSEVMQLYDKESHDISDAIRYRTEQHKALEAAMQHIRREQDLLQFGKLDQSRTAFEKVWVEYHERLAALETDTILVENHEKDFQRKKVFVQSELSHTTSQMQTYNHFLAQIPEGMIYLSSSDYIRLKKAFDNLMKKIKSLHDLQQVEHQQYQVIHDTREDAQWNLLDNSIKIKAKLQEAENDYQQYMITKDKYSCTVTILTETKDTTMNEIPKFTTLFDQILQEKKLIEQEVKLLDDELQYINAAKLYLDEVRVKVGIEQARAACRTGLGRILAGNQSFIPNNVVEASGLKWRKQLFQLKRQNGNKPLTLLPCVMSNGEKFKRVSSVVPVYSRDTECAKTFPNVELIMEGKIPSYVVFDQKESAPDEIFDPRTLPATAVRKILPMQSYSGYAPVFMVGIGRTRGTGTTTNPRPTSTALGASPVGNNASERPASTKYRTMTPPASMPSYDQYDTVQAQAIKMKRTLSVQKLGPVVRETSRAFSGKFDFNDSTDSQDSHTSGLPVVLTEIQKLEKKINDARKAESEFTEKRIGSRWMEVNGLLVRPNEVDMDKLRRETVMTEEELQEAIKRLWEAPTSISPNKEESVEEKEIGGSAVEKDDDDLSTTSSVSSAATASTNATMTSVHSNVPVTAISNGPPPVLGVTHSSSGRIISKSRNPSPLNVSFMAR